MLYRDALKRISSECAHNRFPSEAAQVELEAAAKNVRVSPVGMGYLCTAYDTVTLAVDIWLTTHRPEIVSRW